MDIPRVSFLTSKVHIVICAQAISVNTKWNCPKDSVWIEKHLGNLPW